MALAFGATLGTKVASNVTTSNFATTTSVPSGGLIVMGVGFYKGGTITSCSISGGGLAWQADAPLATPNAGDRNYSVAIFSAAAPVGLAAGTTLTLTLTGGASGFAIGFGAVYFTGADGASWLDAAGSGSAASGTSWTTSVTTTNANDVVVGFAWQDLWATANETPGAGWTEDLEFPNTADTNDFALVHQIVSSTGTYSPNGTFGGGSPYTAIAVAYKAASAGGTQVSATRALSYSIAAQVSATRALSYSIKAQVAATRALSYAITQQVAATRALSYAILAPVSASRALTYAILAQVAATRGLSYDILNAATHVSATRALKYDLIAPTSATRALKYDLLAQVFATRALKYDIVKSVAATRALNYNLIASVSTTRRLTYSIGVVTVHGDLMLLWLM